MTQKHVDQSQRKPLHTYDEGSIYNTIMLDPQNATMFLIEQGTVHYIYQLARVALIQAMCTI